jgi:7-carboxy-7-deazaguanine synthase
VVTGGEPLLQGAALARLLALLPGLRVEVETNGTVAPPAALDRLVAQYNVSPKLAHSGNTAALALLPERLRAWAAEPRAFFKFVIAEASDVDEVFVLAETYAIARERIYLMAEGIDAAALAGRERWLAQLCLVHGLTLSKRLHIELYGDTRGT